MIVFEGLVKEIMLSKDGNRKYVEFADRENFTTYRLTVPVDAALTKGEVTQVEITSMRAFNSQISLDARPITKPTVHTPPIKA